MGAVYMVRHRLLDEIRVIKVMRPQLESDEENRRLFIREAKVAIKLRHPNIAQLYDFTMDEDGTAFIVLAVALARRPLRSAEVVLPSPRSDGQRAQRHLHP